MAFRPVRQNGDFEGLPVKQPQQAQPAIQGGFVAQPSTSKEESLRYLSAVCAEVSGLKLGGIPSLDKGRKASLEAVRDKIASSLNSLIEKIGNGQDASAEMEFLNSKKANCSLSYLLNYKANLQLIWDMFGKDASASPGSQQEQGIAPSFYSSGKIHQALSRQIYSALMDNLNTARIGSWSQGDFEATYGNSENFRQYIDKRCADIGNLRDLQAEGSRQFGSIAAGAGILEEFYYLISPKNPLDPLADAESRSSDLAKKATGYLAATFRFGLEAIRHNQLLYAPPVPDARQIAVPEESAADAKAPTIFFKEQQAEADATNVQLTQKQIKLPEEQGKKPEKQEKPPSFEETYDPKMIEASIADLNGKKRADYLAPYGMLLSKTEKITSDYASKIGGISQKAQTEAYIVMKEAKEFATGCEIALAAASFLTGPAGSAARWAGSAAMGLMIGEGATDEARMIFDEISQGKNAREIIAGHASSIGLYLYMGAMKAPKVQFAMSRVPHVRLGISSFFAYDLGKSLAGLSEQGGAIDQAVQSGQMSQQEAGLAKLDLMRGAITTAAFFSHTVKSLPAEARATAEHAKARLQAAYDNYISSKQPGALQLVKLESGEVVEWKAFCAQQAMKYLNGAKDIGELKARANDLSDPDKVQQMMTDAESGKNAPGDGMREPQPPPAMHQELFKEAMKASREGDYALSATRYFQAAESGPENVRNAMQQKGMDELAKLSAHLEAAGKPEKAFAELVKAKNEMGNALDAIPNEAAEFLAGKIGRLAKNYYAENGSTPQGQVKAARMMQEASEYYADRKSRDRAALLSDAAGIFGRNGLHDEEARSYFEIGTFEAREKALDACHKWRDRIMDSPGMGAPEKVDAAAKFYAEMAGISGQSDYRAYLYLMASHTYSKAGMAPEAFIMYGKAISADSGVLYSDTQDVLGHFNGMYTYLKGRQGIDFGLNNPAEKQAARGSEFYAQELFIDETASRLGGEAECFLQVKKAELRQKISQPSKSAFDDALGLIPAGKRLEFIDALLTQKPSWEGTEKDNFNGQLYIARTLLKMQALEAVVEGGVKTLYSEYGIRHFSRYTLHELVMLCDKASGEKPVATISRQRLEKNEGAVLVDEVIVLQGKALANALQLENGHATNFEAGNGKAYTVERVGSKFKIYQAVLLVSMPCDDYNGAFNHQQVNSRETTSKFDVVFVEAGDVKELARRVISVSGKRGKISTDFWGGHGYYMKTEGRADATVVLGSGTDGRVRLTDFMQGGVVARTSSDKLSGRENVMLPGKEALDAAAVLAFASDPLSTQAVFETKKGSSYIAEKDRDGGIAIRKEGYLTKYFTDNVSVIMLSCSQGAEGAFAQSGSIRFPGVNFQGPPKPTSLNGVDYKGILENGGTDFHPRWQDTENRVYNAGRDVSGQPRGEDRRNGELGLDRKEPAGKAKGQMMSADNGGLQRPETGFASLIDTRNAMKTNDLVDKGLAKPLQEIVVFERITIVPKEKLGDFAEKMGQYMQEYPDVAGTKEPIRGLSGLMDSFHVWHGQEISGQRVNGEKDIVDFVKYLVDNKLPHELGCRMGALDGLLMKEFGTNYQLGTSADRFYGTAPVFEISCADGKHYIAKVEDISQEVFAHDVHRMFGNEPGYMIFSGNGVGVMEIVDGTTLKHFLENGMPGMDKELLAPGNGSAQRERFISTIMESMARQVAFTMDDTTEGNYMVLPDGSARRIDFMDCFFQKAENIALFDIRIDNALGLVSGKSNKYEQEIMQEAFTQEWARLQARFAENKAEVKEAFVAHEWGWKAMMAGERNFGWQPGQNLGEVMFKNLEKNLSYTPEQAWGMFVGGTGMVK